MASIKIISLHKTIMPDSQRLIVSYHGRILRCSRKKQKSAGTILTRNGEVWTRAHKCSHWVQITTPEVFFFHDTKSRRTYLVDCSKEIIRQTQPKGRIFDWTNRVIYDFPEKPKDHDLSEESSHEVERFSAKCGQFCFACDQIAPPVEQCPESALITANLTQPAATNIFPIVDWEEVYDEDPFDPETGIFTADRTGDYQVNAVLSYLSPNPLRNIAATQPPFGLVGRSLVPRYILVRHEAGSDLTQDPGLIVADAPVTANRIVETEPEQGLVRIAWDLMEAGQAVINVGLRLNKGDMLRLYYIDDPTLIPFRTVAEDEDDPFGYQLIRNGTTFNAHFLDCAPSTN